MNQQPSLSDVAIIAALTTKLAEAEVRNNALKQTIEELIRAITGTPCYGALLPYINRARSKL